MALWLLSVVAGERARRLLSCALLLIAAVIGVVPARAQNSDEAYSATVKVDATAESAAAARDVARIDGQRRALAAVIQRLSDSSEPAKLPKLDDKAITDMVDSFEVANERMSAVRYIADYTFHFRPSKVRRLVRVAESAPAENVSKPAGESSSKTATAAATGSKPIVVLPVYKQGPTAVLWDDPNDWRTAWAQRSVGSGSSRLILPLGDAGDLAAIDAEKAGSGDSEALRAITKQNGGSEVVVAFATAQRQDSRLAGIEVSVKRYREGRLIDTHENSYDAQPGESEADFLKRAVNTVAADIDSAARRNPAPRSDQQANLAVTVQIASLADWVQVRDKLASISAIRKIDLLSLSRQEAKIQVKYVGSQDQLKSSLAEVSLDLAGADPLWRIQLSGAAGQH